MFAKTLKTVVLKTVSVVSVKLSAPADRIGRGLRASANPTDNLSLGQHSLPHYPEHEPAPVQAPSAMQMPAQMHTGGIAAPTAGPAGCPKAPGSSAVTRPLPAFTGWQRSSWPGSTGRTATFNRFTRPGRNRLLSDRNRDNRADSDCQSPGRKCGKPIGHRAASPAATAKK